MVPKQDSVILEMRDIYKHFGGVQALNGAQFELRSGEVMALVGENGAGKTTLMNILGGIYAPDSGMIILADQEVAPRHPIQMKRLGVGMVHQEAAFAPELSIAENILMGNLPTNTLGLVDSKALIKRAEEILQKIRLKVNPRVLLRDLSLSKQRLVEISRVLAKKPEPKLLVFDEPTEALTREETQHLFSIINQLRNEGKSIVYISHRLDEIFEVADRVTVFRSGERVAVESISAISKAKLIELMIGRRGSRYALSRKNRPDFKQVLLEARNISVRGRLNNLSFKLHRGEILGVAGLVGAGKTELSHALFGILPIDSGGEVFVKGNRVRTLSPSIAKDLGLGLLPENRDEQGVISTLSVRENITLPILHLVSGRGGLIDKKRERSLAEKYRSQLDIVTLSIEQCVRHLSGGNQQKVVLAKWLALNSEILLLDEPTKGIDVKTKRAVHSLLVDVADQGKGIILLSSELPEIMSLADRIMVLREGRIVAFLTGEKASPEDVLTYMLGVASRSM